MTRLSILSDGSAREGNPLNTASCPRGLLAVTVLLTAVPAWGQRMQFPSTVADGSPYATTPGPPVALDGTIQPTDPNWSPYGAVQPVDPNWDPYGDPTAEPPAVLPQDGSFYTRPDGMLAPRQRLLQQIKFEYTWLSGGKGDEFEVQDGELSGTFAVPFYYAVAPLLLTPGFALHLWEGPDDGPLLPPQAYSAYLDIGWRPQISPAFSADLGVRPGVYTDFDETNTDSLRIQGRALGIWTLSPRAQVVAGVLYLDRIQIKLLPAGGLIWTPNEDTRYEILFPRPKLAQRITTIGNTDWWVYLAGELGGGSWTVKLDSGLGERFDYNDLRASVGLEWVTFTGLKGYFEAGYVFDRELEFAGPTTDFEPSETFMLRAGIVY